MDRIRAFPGRIVFDHLPKTGGQAVNAWLTAEFGSGCVSPHLDGQHSVLIRQFGGQYSVLCGHVSFEHAEGLDPRYQYITLFRDPLDRIVSWLYFVVNNHEESLCNWLIPLVRRFLDSEGGDCDAALLPFISNLYVEHFSRVNGSGREPDAVRVTLALQAIRQYEVVGLHGEMSSFLAAVAAITGLQAPDGIALVNVTKQRPPVSAVSDPMRRRLLALNQLDLSLYEEVRALVLSRQAGAAALAPPPSDAPRWQPYCRPGSRSFRTDDIIVAPITPREGGDVVYGQTLHFDVDFWLARGSAGLLFGIHIVDSEQRPAYGVNSDMLDRPRMSLAAGPHRITHQIRALLPAGKYVAGFAIIECTPDGERELAWYDAACEFQVHHPAGRMSVGYADLAGGMTVDAVVDSNVQLPVTQTGGALSLRRAPDAVLRGQVFDVDVEIANRSGQRWQGDAFRPIKLSYHWLDQHGELVVFEGMRSGFPPDGLAAGGTAGCRMQVQAPLHAGSYLLVLTVMQENVAWFEASGFEAARRPFHVR